MTRRDGVHTVGTTTDVFEVAGYVVPGAGGVVIVGDCRRTYTFSVEQARQLRDALDAACAVAEDSAPELSAPPRGRTEERSA